MSGIQKAIEHFGSQAALAQELGVSPMTVTQWKKRGVPASRCREIETACDGAVTRYELCPDVFGERPQPA